MTREQRARCRRFSILAGAALLVACVWSNIYYYGQAWGGHYDWVCDDCGISLYTCPLKKIKQLSVPDTYEAHVHHWRLDHRPPHWSRWKPWHWLAYAGGDSDLLKAPDPETVFQSAYPAEKHSHPDGLRKLAADPNYAHADEIAGWYAEVNSRPE